ncbi:MAG: dihydrofolate reductase family protein [Leptospira sp.]|nr:dihydrofolate reductase family protein [Leptospira sp.]
MDESILQELVCRESFLAMGFSSPNPPVAAIIEDCTTGEIISHAHTQKTGNNHAEREVYRKFSFKLAGPESTLSQPFPTHNLYVTLQPCTHQGRTPPCRDLILEKKPKNLYIGHEDPNPLVVSKDDPNLYKTESIGVIYKADLKAWSEGYLIGFFSRITKKRPRIILKSAVTQDGYFAGLPPQRESISSPVSNIPLSLLRAKVDAVLVGPKTIQIDTPSLHFRLNYEANANFPSSSNPIGNILSSNSSCIFWENLLEYSFDDAMLSHHFLNRKDYQPDRVFILGRENFHTGEAFNRFIQNQCNLSREYPGAKVIFFTTKSKDAYSDSFIDSIHSIPQVHIEYPGGSFSMQIVLESLAGFGINNVLVEGGNFIYESIFSCMDEDDDILTVTNTEMSWETGIRPFHLQSEDLEEVWTKMLKKDRWKIYKKRGNACLPV